VIPKGLCNFVAGGDTGEGGKRDELVDDKSSFVVFELECKIGIFGNFQASNCERSEKDTPDKRQMHSKPVSWPVVNEIRQGEQLAGGTEQNFRVGSVKSQ
jgi:hypothetical protein